MFKIVFFENEETEEQIPIKVLCNKNDTNEKVEEKAFNVLADTLEDEYEAIDYNAIDIKELR
jgi:hypothetical protein